MPRTLFTAFLCGFAIFGQTHAQQVIVHRDASAAGPAVPPRREALVSQAPKAQPVKENFPKAQPVTQPILKAELATVQPAKEQPAIASPVKSATVKAQPVVAQSVKSERSKSPLTRVQPAALTEPPKELTPNPQPPRLVSAPIETAFVKLANGFDFPVGRPHAEGYYKARGFRSRGHVGEDWNGVRGGDTDLGDPIYSIGDGIVVFARDCHMGWGNVIIVRHSYREGGVVKTIDALYGHLNSILVRRGHAVSRGQKIATMGNAHGLYDTHLHLEIRKNLEIGMSRDAFPHDSSNYYDPSQFIASHRQLPGGGGTYRVAMNTFTLDAKIRWDKTRNYAQSHHRGGSKESAAALKKALALQN